MHDRSVAAEVPHIYNRYSVRKRKPFRVSQRAFTRFYLENPHIVELDYNSVLFYTLHSSRAPLLISASGGIEIMDIGTPGIFHANAGDGKAFYKLLINCWDQATAQGNSSALILAQNLPYFRGIAHYNAGDHYIAAVSFMAHAAYGKEYVAEAVYNAACVLHQLGMRDLARLYYLRALKLKYQSSHPALRNLAVLEFEEGTMSTVEAEIRRLLAGEGNLILQGLASSFEAFKAQTIVAPITPKNDVEKFVVMAYDPYEDIALVHHPFTSPMKEFVAKGFRGSSALVNAFCTSAYFRAVEAVCPTSASSSQPAAGSCHLSKPERINIFFILKIFHLMDNGDVGNICKQVERLRQH